MYRCCDKTRSPPLDKQESRSSFVRTSRSAFSSFPPPPSSSSGGASPSPRLPSSSAASFISTLTCSLSPSVRNQRSSVVSDTMAVSSSCAGDSWQISQTTTVTRVSLAPLWICKTIHWNTIKKVTPATLELSYLVCVDVGGPVAPAAVVTPKVTQEPPGQARQIPLIERNIQFGSFAGWARQAFKGVWTRSRVKARDSNRLLQDCWTLLNLPSSGSRGRLWEGVCSRGPSLTASCPDFTVPLHIYRRTQKKN